jgi:ethanolamine ammonia-lyase large subunit
VRTLSRNREDYILHPPTGEQLAPESLDRLKGLNRRSYDVQIVISDGLDALALTDENHLAPYLKAVRSQLSEAGYRVAPELVVVRNGRVRAGYRIGEALFGRIPDRESTRVVLHIIGERPGSGHRAYSVYLTAIPVSTWAETGQVDHNVTRVISGIADTALDPVRAASDTVRVLQRQ